MDQFTQEDWGTDRSKNILLDFDELRFGHRPKDKLWHLNNIKKTFQPRIISGYEIQETICAFERRVTAISWHPKIPSMLAAACKGGGLVVSTGRNTENSLSGDLEFMPKVITTGIGPGGAIFSIKFDNEMKMYTASLDGTIKEIDLYAYLYDLAPKKPFIEYHNTEDFNTWFTAMDISENFKTLISGDNKGHGRLFHLKTRKLLSTTRFHTTKVHHIEFNAKNPHIFVTAGLEIKGQVKLWDLRKLADNKPLCVLPHLKGVNSACFNPVDGSKLLTCDQDEQIRIYGGPIFENPEPIVTIKHPHKQFQHLTHINADWHPLFDVIVAGSYSKGGPRPIEFFDGNNGNKLGELNHPSGKIISLNVFSPKGDFLASGMGRELVLWNSPNKLEELSEARKALQKKGPMEISDAMRNALRGINNNDDEKDEDEDDISAQKKKRKGKNTSSKTKVTTASKTTSKKSVEDQRQNKKVKLTLPLEKVEKPRNSRRKPSK